jgi:large subunit ribosomal protein L18
MGHGPRYRVAMRRRREGKTNYHRRLKMVLSGKLRLIIRTSLNSTIVQVAKASIIGDEILCSSHTKQLKKFEWNYYTGNIPSAYLTGYLCGLKAIKAGIKEEVILDLGITVHKHRVLAAFKGFIDSGVKVPYKEKFFNGSNIKNRMDGSHIKEYAEILKKEDSEKYNRVFSNYIKLKLDPAKIPDQFAKTKTKIEKEI